MSSGPRRDQHASTSNNSELDSHREYSRTSLDQTAANLPPHLNPSGAHQSGDQALGLQAQYSPNHQPSPMALQPPLLPSMPASVGKHHSAFSLDSTSSRTSFPSPREPYRYPEAQVATPDTSPNWPGRRSSLQKRAFRQRRKDPSCDACRERKVKCDATDARSCTECATRGVRCQFTNDTNRRMSSIKQIQELERQLAQARQHNERLKLRLGPEDRMALDIPSESSVLSLSRAQSASGYDYRQTRKNVRNYARGIFRPPILNRHWVTPTSIRLERSLLPDRQESIYLIEVCRNSFVNQLPLIDWDSFLQSFHSIYETASVDNVSKPWVALFMSVLAMGSLQNRDHRTTRIERQARAHLFASKSSEYLSFTDEDTTLDHCRAALLLSVYHIEANKKAAGWTWLSVSLAFAFELRLNDYANNADTREVKEREQLWWSVYSWERLLGLEMSQPSMIDDDDSGIVANALWPSDHEEENDGHLGSGMQDPSILSRSVIPLMRLYGSLRKAKRNAVIAAATLLTFDSLLGPISATFPRPTQPANSYDTTFFTFTMLVSNASLTLNRHNLSPACSIGQRLVALDGCILAARATVRCIRDSLIHSGADEQSIVDCDTSNSNWAAWLRSSTSSLTCTHLWRCILVLAFALELESALLCAKASGAIDGMKEINLACGRNLELFLEIMIQKLRLGQHHRQILLDDMEMLAYVSGDTQGDSRASWIWQDGEVEAAETSAASASNVHQQTLETEAQGGGSAEEYVWSRVESLLRQLERERTQQRPLPRVQRTEGRSLSQATEEETRSVASGVPTTRPMSPSEEGSKRMSIASII